MKKVTDERLILRMLKNFRISFLVQNAFLIGVLIWQLFHGKHFEAVVAYQNIPFAALMVGVWTEVVLSVNVRAVIDDQPKVRWQRFVWHGALAFVAFSGFFYWLIGNQVTPGKHVWISLLCGAVVAAVPVGMEIYANHFRSTDDE
ncbi:MAG: hypothetical protein LKJ69_11940 [Lactobacillus sp.]|jgi:hypothetical protein|nr:hypothetical protein [Lactobacillus sp.]MCI2034077.1 hypothetical protein [Lactobacillus sp.]